MTIRPLAGTDGKLSGRTSAMFILLCSAVYFTSYITRINYGAVMAEIIRAEGIAKSEAGAISTAAFLTYGAGQLVSGFIGDRIRPRGLIIFGLAATSVCNLIFPTADGAMQMALIWGANGFFQAMFWPPLVKLMATLLDAESYKRACVSVSAASSIGTIVVYLAAPAAISLSGWRTVFYIGAGFGVLTAIMWAAVSPTDIKPVVKTGVYTEKPAFPAGTISLLVWLALAITLQGILRDGLTTWMPTYVSETFGLSTSASILTGIALPVFSVICYNAASLLDRKLHGEILSASVMFGIGTAASAALIFLGSSAVASVALMALITGCMHGVNLMIISRVPAYFAKYGRISTVSGLLNAFTYLGSGVSGFGIALLSESFGWKFTIISWFMAAAVGTAVCVFCIKKWTKFIKE